MQTAVVSTKQAVLIYIYMSVYWSLCVLCVYLYLSVISNQSFSQLCQNYRKLNTFSKVLHSKVLHSKVLLVLRQQGSTSLGPSYHKVK